MDWELLKRTALENGLSDIQVDERWVQERSMRLFKGNIDALTSSDCRTWSITGIYQGHKGHILIEDDAPTQIPNIIAELIASAEVITSTDQPELYAGEKQDFLQNKQEVPWLKQPLSAKIALLKEIECKLLQSDLRVQQVMQVSYEEQESVIILRNSKGLDAQRTNATVLLSTELLVQEGEQRKSAYEIVNLNTEVPFDVDGFVKRLSAETIAKLNPKAIPSGMYPTLIQGKAMAAMLNCFANQFHGEQVAQGISLLKDQLHKVLFDKKVTLVDDPFLAYGIRSVPFDDEGVTCRYKKLIDHGRLECYLHHLKSAQRMGCEPMGNGFHQDIAYTNLYLENGKSSYEEMLQAMQNGIIITEVTGLHAGWNQVTTQFSLQASGFYVEAGKIKHSLNLITIAGNFMELLKTITMVGNDLQHFYTGIGSPSVLFPQLALSGEQ
ncbi:MAG: TldD/PmbA family protein [Erysipelotrichaceae bacterium]|nr:TldD/PmbA family protein [Erysipelotrichaceae bacterium]